MLNQYIDHTNLNPLASSEEIINLCKEAQYYNFRAVCVHPYAIKLAKEILNESEIGLASVIDFPFGAERPDTRMRSVEAAVDLGADEIDIVAPLHLIKANDWKALKDDLARIRKISQQFLLKVIIEVSLFSQKEVFEASKVCASVGVDFVKTSTGIINKRPTEVQDIEIIKKAIEDYPSVHIKASAGIKNAEQAQAIIDAGAMRIGTSSALKIIGAVK